MKTNINHSSKNADHNGYRSESLSVKDALIWFTITVVALCIAGTSQAKEPSAKKDSPVKISH